jgi:hypothetical protein
MATDKEKAIRERAQNLANFGQETVWQETGVGYWEKGFWDACIEMATQEIQQEDKEVICE